MARLLLLGGLTTAYHNFDEMGPVIADAMREAGFEVDATTEMEALSKDNLGKYDAFLNYTTDRDISDDQWEALHSFVVGGGGYIGIHNATDTFENRPEALRLIGGHFITHPAIQDVPVKIADPEHPVTQGVDDFSVNDEMYVMEHWPESYHLLAHSDLDGGNPIAWVREEGKGRVFYLSLGHNAETFSHRDYRRLLLQGSRWAAGLD
jgi:uncharacterized protein